MGGPFPAGHWGFRQPFLDHYRVVHDGVAMCGEARRLGRRVVVEDVRASDLFLGTPEMEVMEAAGVRAVQSTPLCARDGRLLGIFSTHWTEPHRPDDGTVRVLDLLAREAAHLLEHRQREEALRDADRR
jgi:GAF domain-containing protein